MRNRKDQAEGHGHPVAIRKLRLSTSIELTGYGMAHIIWHLCNDPLDANWPGRRSCWVSSSALVSHRRRRSSAARCGSTTCRSRSATSATRSRRRAARCSSRRLRLHRPRRTRAAGGDAAHESRLTPRSHSRPKGKSYRFVNVDSRRSRSTARDAIGPRRWRRSRGSRSRRSSSRSTATRRSPRRC